MLSRLAFIGLVLLSFVGLFAYAGGWLTPARLTPAKLVATFQAVNGPHPGFRRNHAKGVCIGGWFESNGDASALSKADVFKPGRVPVVGRFALAGGMRFCSLPPGAMLRPCAGPRCPRSLRSHRCLLGQPAGIRTISSKI